MLLIVGSESGRRRKSIPDTIHHKNDSSQSSLMSSSGVRLYRFGIILMKMFKKRCSGNPKALVNGISTLKDWGTNLKNSVPTEKQKTISGSFCRIRVAKASENKDEASHGRTRRLSSSSRKKKTQFILFGCFFIKFYSSNQANFQLAFFYNECFKKIKSFLFSAAKKNSSNCKKSFSFFKRIKV